MQVATPTASPAPNSLSPSRQITGSSDTKPSAFASPRRLRRSLRLSGASFSSPQALLNKENLGATPLNQPSTSAKTLDIGLTGDDKLSSSRLSSPLSSNSTRQSSPLCSRSSPIRHATPLRRAIVPHSDNIVSSSDESDDSTLVFFGKPSSAEKKKRVHYEQRVLDKRLKHKDSLDLTRKRPISFNPDDTMLLDDQHAYGWSYAKPTSTPSNMGKYVLSSEPQSPEAPESPSVSRSSARNSSPTLCFLCQLNAKRRSNLPLQAPTLPTRNLRLQKNLRRQKSLLILSYLQQSQSPFRRQC